MFLAGESERDEETEVERPKKIGKKQMNLGIVFPGPKRRVRRWETSDNWRLEWIDGYPGTGFLSRFLNDVARYKVDIAVFEDEMRVRRHWRGSHL